MGEQGFTITEFLIACALLSLLMAAIVKSFALFNDTYTAQNTAANLQQIARTGMDIMSQNIRMAGFNPLKIAGVGIQGDSSGNRIQFSYDADADGNLADNEVITFFHEDNRLKRQLGDGDRVAIIDNVTDLKFIYRDVDNNVTGDPSDIKTVEISMTVTQPAGPRRTISRTYATRVMCRNLGL